MAGRWGWKGKEGDLLKYLLIIKMSSTLAKICHQEYFRKLKFELKTVNFKLYVNVINRLSVTSLLSAVGGECRIIHILVK